MGGERSGKRRSKRVRCSAAYAFYASRSINRHGAPAAIYDVSRATMLCRLCARARARRASKPKKVTAQSSAKRKRRHRPFLLLQRNAAAICRPVALSLLRRQRSTVPPTLRLDRRVSSSSRMAWVWPPCSVPPTRHAPAVRGRGVARRTARHRDMRRTAAAWWQPWPPPTKRAQEEVLSGAASRLREALLMARAPACGSHRAAIDDSAARYAGARRRLRRRACRARTGTELLPENAVGGAGVVNKGE